MEINTITEKEYTQDKIQNNVNEIFGQNNYVQKPDSTLFQDMRERIKEMIEGVITKDDFCLQDEINSKFLELDFGAEFDINADKIGVNDAIFFVNLLNQQNLINYSVEDNKINLTTSDNSKINPSNPLMNLLQTSLDTKKPIRLDFDNNITVILKLDNKGKVQAHFIPSAPDVENYLKTNISVLRQRFDEEEINYSQLTYSKYKENNSKNNQNKKRNQR